MEAKVPPFLKDTGKGWVTAEYAMLPGSTHTRADRDANKKGRAQEISRLIGRSLRAVIDMAAMGPVTITLDCDVIQADGGTRTAAITGAYVALHDALSRSVALGSIPSLPLTGACAAEPARFVRHAGSLAMSNNSSGGCLPNAASNSLLTCVSRRRSIMYAFAGPGSMS